MEKLDPQDIQDILALTPLQEGMLFHYLQEPHSGFYFEQLSLEISGEIDVRHFENAWNAVIETNEMLRTVFRWEKLEKPSQVILKKYLYQAIFYDLSHIDNTPGKAAALEEIKIKDRRETFDLHGVPFRVTLCKLAEKKFSVIISNHHILYDGWSNAIILKEFFKFYNGFCMNQGLLLKIPAKPPFKEFVKWLQTRDHAKHERFWSKYLAGFETPMELPIKNIKKTTAETMVTDTDRDDCYAFTLENSLSDRLNVFVKNNRLTPASIFYSAWGILLAKYSGRGDVIFGTTVSGRSGNIKGIEDMVGLFINTIPLRFQSTPHVKLLEMVSGLENVLKKREEFENTPLPDIQRAGMMGAGESLFDTILSIENYPLDNGLLAGNSLLSLHSYSTWEMTHYALSAAIMPFNEIEIKLSFKPGLFEKEIIENLAGHFKIILQTLVENPGLKFSQLEIISREEKHRVLYEFNNTAGEYPDDKTIHQLFGEQVEKSPDRIAVIGPAVSSQNYFHISYRHLDIQSGRLAGLLLEKNVRPDNIVGIMMERCVETIIGILGILKSGGAYLPIDPDYPQERIDYMLNDSGTAILITDFKEKRIMNCQLSMVNCQLLMDMPSPVHDSSSIIHRSNQLAYIIYTSGSTGKPKGVMVEHRSVVNLICHQDEYFNINHGDRILQFSSICFDASVEQIFIAFSSGAALVLIDTNTLLDMEKLAGFVFQYQVTHIHAVPSFLNNLQLPHVPQLKRVIAGGDVCPISLAQKWSGCLNFYNEYGPTETTVTSIEILVKNTNDFRLPIGKPIHNTIVYILDSFMKPVPLGVTGELYIGGAGVARGYLNRPELTIEKFVRPSATSNPFEKGFAGTDLPKLLVNHQSPITNHHLPNYRTGDWARWLADGNIEFLGRIDSQVKIRGFRIELEEIEAHLLAHPEIKETAVINKEDVKGDKYLCAYIVFKPTSHLTITGLREYLRGRLPEYMVPSFFVYLDKLPLTATGKIDRAALPDPGGIHINDDVIHVPPANAREKILVDTWEKVLGRNNIGIHENFFMTGGDSIKAIQVISRMSRAGYKLEMKDIFNYPVIAALAPRMQKLKRVPDQATITGLIPLTPIQKAFFDAPRVNRHHYNQAVMFYSKTRLDKELIRLILKKIQEHHDALRMSYEINRENGEMKQMAHGPDYPLSLEEFEINNQTGNHGLERIVERLQTGIDLEKGPVMKPGLLHLEDGDRLLMVIHHLVIDGVSWRILLEDINTLYDHYQRGVEPVLPPKTDSFKSWSEKLSAYADSKIFFKEKEYWQKLESQEFFSIPTDFEVVDNFVKDTANVSFTLQKEETGLLLTRVNEVFRTEINDILLTALAMGINQTFGQDRILIALEGHGREDILEDMDVSRTVGWFTAVYPVVLRLSHAGNSNNPGRQIKEIKETLRRIPHKGTGYGILKYLTGKENKKELQFNTKPQISFNYMGQFDADVRQISFLEIARESTGNWQDPETPREYQLDVVGMTREDCLTITLYYNVRHFKPGTMTALAGNFEAGLKHLIASCCAREKIEPTPADFTFKGLSIDSIDRLLKEYHDIEDIYTLTPTQEGMSFHAMADSSSSVYFEQTSFRLRGELNIPLVEKSFNELMKRHDILRTAFVYKDIEHHVQVVLRERSIDIYYEDISEIKEIAAKENYLREFKKRDKERPFDLSKQVPVRLAIFRWDNGTYEFVWSFHHILMDGWSLGIINNEFFEIYTGYLEQRPYRLPAVFPYRDYIQWLENLDKEESAQYWANYLDSFIEQTGIPRSNPLPQVLQVFQGDSKYEPEEVSFVFDREKTAALNKTAAVNHTTLNTLLHAAWGILLGKYNFKEDVVFGAVVSGRPSQLEGIETMVGLFINTIPVRIRFDEGMSLAMLFRGIRENAVAGEAYHYHPLADIQSLSPLKQHLIDHILVYENYPLAEQIGNHGKFKLTNIEIFTQTNYDFGVLITGSKQLTVTFKYNGNVYEREYIKRLAGHFGIALEQVSAGESLAIRELTFLPDTEKAQVLYEFNNTSAGYPADKTIHQLFEDRVKRGPDGTALVGACPTPITLSYNELNERSDQLSGLLSEKGVKADHMVGIMMERSVEMITGIMGILKSGGAYLPIDPEYPQSRVSDTLADCRSPLLLTQTGILKNHSFTALQGLRNIRKKPVVTSPCAPVANMNNLPFPDRSLVSYEKYNRFIGQAMVRHSISLQGTRGCPYNCAYCHKIWPKKQTARSAENIYEEVKLYYDMGVRRFALIDDIFNLDIKNSTEFFRKIVGNRLDLHFFFPNGVRGDILTRDYIDLMVEAGTINIALALETASPRLQKLIKKNLNLDKFQQSLDYLQQKYPQVILELFTMHGFPTETEEEALMTLNFIKRQEWLHFPYVHILKIYPNTDMAELAMANGVSKEAIAASANLAYHQLPDTLPFDKSFTLNYQADYFNNYFLSKERLLHVLPYQAAALTHDELVQKYDSYLPEDIDDFEGLLNFAGINREELGSVAFRDEAEVLVPDLDQKMREHFPVHPSSPSPGALRILLLDLSQYFSSEKNMLYNLVEPPLGLMYLLTYLYSQLGEKIAGKIAKARIDFDNYDDLRKLLEDFKPDIIGIRTLTLYRDFFHRTVAMIRQWGIDVPIMAGGPYASSDYNALLQDGNIDLAVLGEGEIITTLLMEKFLANGKKIPDADVLKQIPGIAFIPNAGKIRGMLAPELILMDSDDLTRQLNKKTVQPIEKPGVLAHPRDTAYTIFTSGSTGKPKGVMIEHRNVVRLLFNEKFQFAFNEGDTWTMFHSHCFDFSVWEIFGALLYGGKLVIVPKMMARNTGEFLGLLMREAVTVLNQTPSAFYNLIDEDLNSPRRGKDLYIKYVIFGGEALTPLKLKRWFERYPQTRFINMFGITETTVHVTFKELSGKDIALNISNIGKPIPTLYVYILDRYLKPAPIGIAGELCVGGDGLGRGYLNRVELTREKFVINPYKPGERLYRSGDLGRFLENGDIEYLGRIDQQVKIRGFRIELGEIEALLLGHERIKEAVLTTYESNEGDKYLCAYVVVKPDQREGSNIASLELRAYLANRLPDYMIPTYFVQLAQIPLTANGKINKKALPDPVFAGGPGGYVPPGNKIEMKLVEIWSALLGIEQEKMGVHDDFFERGGHSLKVTGMAAKIHKELDIEIDMVDIFENSTISKLARVIEKSQKNNFSQIECVEKKEYYELSSAQRRLYVLQQMDIAGTAYNISAAWILEGKLDDTRLEQVISRLIKRHESLRTSFHVIAEKPVQLIHGAVAFSLERNNEKNKSFAELFQKRPFDLSCAPLLRLGLLELETNRHLLIMDMHHIIADGISAQVLIQDFTAFYEGKTLNEIRLQYKDYAVWQNREKGSEHLLKQADYWKNQFAGELPVLHLPTDSSRSAVQSFTGDKIDFKLNHETFVILKDLAQITGSTLYIVILAIYTIFLAKLSNGEDIIIGSPTAGRRHADLEKIIGMFVNTLALRNYPIGEKKIIDFIVEVRQRTLEAFENQEYQYEDLVEDVMTDRDLGRNPLFDTMFALQNIEMQAVEIPGLKVSPYPQVNKVSLFDLSLIAVEVEDNFLFTFEYSTTLFKRETIQRFSAYFNNIIQGFIKNKEQRIADLEILTETEKNLMVFEFNNTGSEYPKEKAIDRLFVEQVERTPDGIALVGPGFQTCPINLSYDELNRQSGRLAGLLIERGVQWDHIVAIMMERSVEMVAGILAILKAGGAYLPIAPDYPKERVEYMLKDSGTKILLTNDETKRDNCQCSIVNCQLSINGSPRRGLQHSNRLAYIIYTSGSTGKPKGVMIEHRNVVNVVHRFGRQYGVKPGTRVILMSDYTFDASVDQIFGSLLHGASLYIVEKKFVIDIEALRKYMNKHGINLINFVPALLNELLGSGQELESLNIVISGAEKLEDTIKDNILAKGYRLFNHYGPTETTVDALTLECSDSPVNLGKPIANVKIHIIDRWAHEVPVGVPGELCISGAGLARGYLNKPELTAEKFRPLITLMAQMSLMKNINSALQPNFHHSNFYCTGDLARWLPDGNVSFLGRIDQQVKIRGYRIELGEIETQLSMHPDIKEAVVIAGEDSRGDKYLCAYFVPRLCAGASRSPVPGILRKYLENLLPGYLVPSFFIEVEKIPLMPNGKTDRRALPEPVLKDEERYAAPRTEIEAAMVGLWAEVLGLQTSIGIDDNFFQLGGHSLKATILVSRIEKIFNIKIPLAEIFKNPRIRELAQYIKNAAQREHKQVELAEKKEYYALSSAQKRLFFLWQLEKDSVAYNIPSIMILEGIIDKNKMEQCIRELIQRHESLRTSFISVEENPVQRIQDEAVFEIDKSFAELFQKRPPGGPPEAIIKSFLSPFDLSCAPLLRAGLVKIAEDKHIFMVDMHHIVSDGLSAQVLVQDFSDLYGGRQLPGIQFQYKDYAEWQNREKEKENHLKQGEYWRNEFAGEIPVLELPADYPRPTVQDFAGNSVEFILNSETTGALKALALETGATLYIVLLTFCNIFLARLSSREDIIIGSPIAGRKHADLEKIIGMFVNTLALRNYPSGEKKFAGFLTEVKEKTLKAFENQEYQYEDLVEKVAVTRDVSRNPLFDAMFVLQNIDTVAIEMPGLKLLPYEYENKTAKFDLTITAWERGQELVISYRYRTALFKRETIERFIMCFKQMMVHILQNPGIKIEEIEIIPEPEKKRVLFDFNDTEAAYPTGQTICRLFEEQVEKTPGNIAVVGEEQQQVIQITYCQLNNRANLLANRLQSKGTRPNSVVGIMVTPSPAMVIGITGILKAGGAFLPIEPGSPAERINYVLNDSSMNILLTQAHLQETLYADVEIIDIEEAALYKGSCVNPVNVIKSTDPVYVIYTSGTTGNPKGVLINHRNLVNYVGWFVQTNRPDAFHKAILTSSFAFDALYTQFFASLLGGHRLHVIPRETFLFPERLLAYLKTHRITYLKVTPSLFNLIVNDPGFTTEVLKEMRFVMLGGEEINVNDVEKAHRLCPHLQIMNHYGPTETTIGSIARFLDFEKFAVYKINPTIGKPIHNTIIYILDKGYNMVPIGIAGQMFIGGDGVGMGYLNKPELTAEKFGPQITLITKIIKRFAGVIYKTGDLARWHADGYIEFLGRADDQVKIRGYRVEPGEIENHLLKYNEIKEAVVLAREKKNKEKYLCAYFVSPKQIKISGLREFLSRGLPAPMIPAYFIQLEKMPLTKHNKLNRWALPEPELDKNLPHAAPPQNEIEMKLAEIWAMILEMEPAAISRDDHFFNLGGHSLKATALVSRIYKEFNVKLPLVKVFQQSTIRELAAVIAQSQPALFLDIPVLETREYYPLSYNQQRLYILCQLQPGSPAFHMAGAVDLHHEVEPTAVTNVLAHLIRAHESFRTAIVLVKGQAVQVVHQETGLPCEIQDLSVLNTEEKAAKLNEIQLRIAGLPFDLSQPPLLRSALVKLAPLHYRLMFNMHHIISDGWSTELLKKEFLRLYEGYREGIEMDLPNHPVQYKDFAVWHNRQLAGPGGKKSLQYWQEALAEGVPPLRLPVDYEIGKEDKAGAGWRSLITQDLKAQLKQLAESNNMTLFTIMFSIYGYVLSHISGQKEVACSVITAGRDHPSLHHIIGFFVNSIILKVRVDGQKPFKEFLNELNGKVIEAFQHQMYPLELVFEKLEMRYPEISASFNVINIGDASTTMNIEADEFVFMHIDNAQDVKFDLEVYVREYANGLEMYWAYKKNMFEPGTMEHMVKLYIKLIEFFCTNPERNLEDYFYERNKPKGGKFQKKR